MTRKSQNKTVLQALMILTTSLSANLANAVATADYYKCNNRLGGEWNYGRAPNVCDANAFGDDNVVFQDYGAVIFKDSEERVSERNRYMQELHAVIRDGAAYYMKKRKPAVSTDELNWWVLAVTTTAAHESYMSQYRIPSDNRLKMMRGDSGHGHGLMQLDDRAHFPAIQSGYGWNLAAHLAYTMDYLYRHWQAAPSKSCVGSETNYQARVRSAWAAYNSGSNYCRWTSSTGAWAQNDKNFYNQLTSKKWQTYIANLNQASKVNIACLIENLGNCSAPTPPDPNVPPPSDDLAEGQLYAVNDGRSCVVVSGTAHCVQEQRDRVCLRVIKSFDTKTALNTTVEKLNEYAPKTYDRHALCTQLDASLMKVGESLKILKSLNIRVAPGTGILGVVPSGTVMSVVDFEVRDQDLIERYYKVTYKTWTGYIYAGNKSDNSQWAVRTAVTVPTLPVARMGQLVKVVASSGINMRSTPGGTLQTLVPKGTVVNVQEAVVRNVDNEVYYRVTYNGRTGYIYSGKLLPQSTVSTWTVVQP